MTLGAGDARYRLGGVEGPVDTVFLGVFRREALEAVGGFDEKSRRAHRCIHVDDERHNSGW